jgi:hypothetical protein
MPNPKKAARETVPIGGREVPLLKAALIAQEADQRSILPGKVRVVVTPHPAPTHVEIAGYRLTVSTAAVIASVADAEGIKPRKVIESVLEEHTGASNRRARTRETRKTLVGAWQLPSNPHRRGGGNRGA